MLQSVNASTGADVHYLLIATDEPDFFATFGQEIVDLFVACLPLAILLVTATLVFLIGLALPRRWRDRR